MTDLPDTTVSLDLTDTVTGLLSSHTVLGFTGPDAATFLQGYLTCDTDLVAGTVAAPGAFTNLKGRVVANGWIWGSRTQINMLLAKSLAEPLADFLRPYMNFSKTRLTIAEAPPLIALGPAAHGISLGESRALIAPDEGAPATRDWPDVSANWLSSCIHRREAVVTAVTAESYLPQMIGLTDLGAVSFEKGCYLGQEVVARAEHRGEVKRRLRHISYSAADALRANDVLTDANGKRTANVICADATNALVVSSVSTDGSSFSWQVGEQNFDVTLTQEL